MKKAIYFFCTDLTKDPAAAHVYEAVKALAPLAETGLTFDGKPVLGCTDAAGNAFAFAETTDVLSHRWAEYLPELNASFRDCDFAGVVNWHEGANAPDCVLTVHSIGDVPSGVYAPTDPVLYRNMLNALRDAAAACGLDGWTACTEATHWSGVVYGQDPARIPDYPVPQYDIEIGSSPACWADPAAARALATALFHVFDSKARPKVLLAAGGVHFESAFSACGLFPDYPVMCAHILPNQWLVSGDYTGEGGAAKLQNAIESIAGGIDGISFHDNLAGPYNAVCRAAAEQLGVPSFKHTVLRDVNRTRDTLGH